MSTCDYKEDFRGDAPGTAGVGETSWNCLTWKCLTNCWLFYALVNSQTNTFWDELTLCYPYPPFVAFFKAPARSGTQKKSRPHDTRWSAILKLTLDYAATLAWCGVATKQTKMAGGSLWRSARFVLENISKKHVLVIQSSSCRYFSLGNQLRADKDAPVDQKLLEILVCPLSKKPLRWAKNFEVYLGYTLTSARTKENFRLTQF